MKFSSTISNQVRTFLEATNVTVRNNPTGTLPDPEERQLCKKLLIEEVDEHTEALDNHDVVELADALADIVYVAYGNALRHGIDLDAVLNEVHRSNMSKLNPDGSVYYYPGTNKVGNGPNYSPPDVARILGITAKE